MVSTPDEEIRFAVVLNGGVSLAVWMGGVVLELNRLTHRTDLYANLMDIVGCRARADVITGTSAGGINGAALALSQVNEAADLHSLRDLWIDQGRFDRLLRPPFNGQPTSLLQGDEFFLPKLQDALRGLLRNVKPTEAAERPVDLRITTTLLRGVPKVTYDDLSQALTQTIHQASFSFRRDPYAWAYPPKDEERQDLDLTSEKQREDLVRRLALAARSTASFPFAFEPSFVRVGCQDKQIDMRHVASWYTDDNTDRSRFAVDGGVLVNTPTKEAIEAIDRMPADGPVRRVMLLVFPHATAPGDEPKPDATTTSPSIVSAGGQLFTAMYSQSGRTYVENVEAHNRVAASRRGGRNDLLKRLHRPGESLVPAVYKLATDLYPHYEDVRIRHTARDVTARQLEVSGSNKTHWSFERVRAAAEQAQHDFGPLPYVPAAAPPCNVESEPGWPWGFTMAERVASAALDLLKRLIWVVCSDDECTEIKKARLQLHEARCTIRRLREDLDQYLDSAGRVSSEAGLGCAFWKQRLEHFSQRMIGPEAREGAEVRAQVLKIGSIVDRAQQILGTLESKQVKLAGLEAWRELLTTASQTAGDACNCSRCRPNRWVSRLLALEIAATCLADTSATVFDQPIELAQVSLQTQNAFAEHSLLPDDKAGGASLARFSGFLKRSWRMNDWIWGRLDAATTLCKIVFDPKRLHQQQLLEKVTAHEVVTGLVKVLFGEIPTELAHLVGKARDELEAIHAAKSDVGCPAEAPALTELAAWGLHVRIICEELPMLRTAILADTKDGGNPRSHGALFVEEHSQLLNQLPSPDTFDQNLVKNVEIGLNALKAFDKAGIGREPLKDEAGSDQMIRTAATAAAVAVTVLDSEKSGLGVVKPVTKALRGGALLPYWIVIGLTTGSRIAQGLALTAGTLGVAMLVLAMFTLLPAWAIAPAATMGTGLVLAMFGYAAVRSGTTLHGLALLTPVVPLVAYAVDRWKHADADPDLKQKATEAATAAVSLAAIAIAAVVLILLGTLPSVRKTPVAVARDRWPILASVLAVALAAGVVVWLEAWPILPDLSTVDWKRVLVCPGVLVATVGSFVAFLGGWHLKVWHWSSEKAWIRERAVHPAAVTAGWAAVYGIAFLLLALMLSHYPFPPLFDPRRWMTSATIVTALLSAAVLLLVVPLFAPRRARKKIHRLLVEEANNVIYRKDKPIEHYFMRRLETHGVLCNYLVKPLKDKDKALTLRRAGRKVLDKVRAKLDGTSTFSMTYEESYYKGTVTWFKRSVDVTGTCKATGCRRVSGAAGAHFDELAFRTFGTWSDTSGPVHMTLKAAKRGEADKLWLVLTDAEGNILRAQTCYRGVSACVDGLR